MSRPKVGDRVRVELRGIGILIEDDGSTLPYKIEFSNGSYAWFPESVVSSPDTACECGGSKLRQPSHSTWCSSHPSGGTPPFKFGAERLF